VKVKRTGLVVENQVQILKPILIVVMISMVGLLSPITAVSASSDDDGNNKGWNDSC